MTDEGKQDWIVGTVLILVLIIVGFSLVLDYGKGLDIRYVSFFIALIGFGILAAIVLAAISLGIDGDGYKPNLVDSSDVRGLAGLPWSRTVAAGVLFVLFVGGGFATQSSVIPIVNPFDSSTLIAKGSELSADHNKYATALRSGVYPGFGEDVAGYLVTSILTFLCLLLFKRFDEGAFSDPLLFGLSVIVSCVTWGFMFASAHALAYGANAPAFIFAWLYGTVTQLVNQLVGAPVSILAHIGHNFVIVASLSVAVCVGGLCAGFLILPRGLLMKPSNRKGNVWLTSIFAVGVIALVLIVSAAFYLGDKDDGRVSVFGMSSTLNCPAGTQVRVSDLVADTNAYEREHDIKCLTVETRGEIVYREFNKTTGGYLSEKRIPGYVCGYCGVSS